MYRKNVASQYLGFVMISITTSLADAAATVTVRLAIDAAAQTTGGGTVTNLGNGQYRYNLAAGDVNGNNITFLFTAPGDFPVEKTIVTTAADPTDAVHFGLSALPNTPVASAGSLITVGTGPGQLSVTGGAANADAKAINGIATTPVTTIKPVMGLSVADTITTVLDLSLTPLAESTTVPPALATPLQKLNFVATLARNKITQSTTTQVLRNDGDTATIGTSIVSDTGTVFTRGQFS